jgi:hypothetical protein
VDSDATETGFTRWLQACRWVCRGFWFVARHCGTLAEVLALDDTRQHRTGDRQLSRFRRREAGVCRASHETIADRPERSRRARRFTLLLVGEDKPAMTITIRPDFVVAPLSAKRTSRGGA